MSFKFSELWCYSVLGEMTILSQLFAENCSRLLKTLLTLFLQQVCLNCQFATIWNALPVSRFLMALVTTKTRRQVNFIVLQTRKCGKWNSVKAIFHFRLVLLRAKYLKH